MFEPTLNAHIPSFNDFAAAQSEFKWLSTQCFIKCLAIFQHAFIVHVNLQENTH